MSWLSSLFKKPGPDPAYTASQKQTADMMAKLGGGAALPPLPTMTPAQQGMGNMPAINPRPIGLPAYLGGGQKTVFPVGLPNQLSMIANQLSAGGYGRPAAISQQLSGVYGPVAVNPRLPPSAARPAAAAPAARAVTRPVVTRLPLKKAVPRKSAARPVRPMGFTAIRQGPSSYSGGTSSSGR